MGHRKDTVIAIGCAYSRHRHSRYKDGQARVDNFHKVLGEVFVDLQGGACKAKDDHDIFSLLMDFYCSFQGLIRSNCKIERLLAVFCHDIHLQNFILELYAPSHASYPIPVLSDSGDTDHVFRCGNNAPLSISIVIHIRRRPPNKETIERHKELVHARYGF